MEADWEIEIGPGAPIIEACWPGFVDLRLAPARAAQLAEAAQFPALASALVLLNAPASSVWTSKCDLWPLTSPAEFDPGELDAPPETALHALGCYIDLLSRGDQQWTFPLVAAESCKTWCAGIHAVPLRSCRADLIVRRALLAPEEWSHGVTAYLAACGPTPAQAQATLQRALEAFTGVIEIKSTIE